MGLLSPRRRALPAVLLTVAALRGSSAGEEYFFRLREAALPQHQHAQQRRRAGAHGVHAAVQHVRGAGDALRRHVRGRQGRDRVELVALRGLLRHVRQLRARRGGQELGRVHHRLGVSLCPAFRCSAFR